MKMFLHILTIVLSMLLFVDRLPAQEKKSTPPPDEKKMFIDGLPVFTEDDMEVFKSIPELKMPENYKTRNLPVVVDNSLLPYMRPIFNQSSLECGQASAVGYTFTYEMANIRNLVANVPENQYPTHFVFNWSNQGSGSACAFFDSWNIVKEVGTPNVVDYGGSLNYGGDARWMSGYDKYYRGMQNRGWDYYSISLRDVDGLTTLKHWINDHLKGDEHGGLANIYVSYGSVSNTLPPGTPEAGKYVVTNFGTYANHALCIVGYHDSIRWDYNNDGQYTNDIDINNDGVIDFRDWEIGGVKLANSYSATSWGNQGYAWCTYNALCRSLAQSGVWNQCASVIEVKEQTDPQFTYKVTITHTSRNKLKVMAGVSTNLNATSPDFVMEFPILSYQGGNKYMQGGTSEADKTLEFGLDVTPLLSEIESGQPARFFLLVDEDDGGNAGSGAIVNWSLMDYTNGMNEIPCAQTNVPITNNDLTTLTIDATLTWEAPEVVNVELPPAIINEPYACQMIGTGGTEPYRWNIRKDYYSYQTTEAFPMVTQQQLYPNNSGSGYAEKEISFEFPFYGNLYKNFYVHTDGYLMFKPGEYPWTFIVDEFNLFKHLRAISPYMQRTHSVNGGGMWYEGDATKATFRWKAIEYSTNNVLNFAVTLYPSGNIEFFYGEVTASAWNRWFAGVCDGDAFNYELLPISNTFNITPNTKVVLEPDYSFTELQITHDGLFYGVPTHPYEAVYIDFYLKDANGMTGTQSLPFFTDGFNSVVIRDVIISAGDDNIIEYGESTTLGIQLQNISEETVEADQMKITTTDPYVILTDSIVELQTFNPGQTITFDNAFAFDVANDVPDNHYLIFDTQITAGSDTYNSHIYLRAYSVELQIDGFSVEDGNNGFLEPGETAQIYVDIKNLGGATAYNINVDLENSDPMITITQSPITISQINGGNSGTAQFEIHVDESAPVGHITSFIVTALADNGFSDNQVYTISLGFVVEDFETGDFSQFLWEFSGTAPWGITQTNVYEGAYCMQSGDVSDNQQSDVFVTMNVIAPSEISFYYKVSSEPSYDYLRFYIDETQLASWAGDVPWAYVSFPVSAGEHTFKWVYQKDISVSNGSDCAWVDYIVFPPAAESVVVYAGPDISICQNQTAQMNPIISGAISVLWTTSGDGTFNAPTAINPVYTPGTSDISNGSVTLTLTIDDGSGGVLSDNLLVVISNLPIVWAGEDASQCADEAFVELSGVVLNTSNFFWATSGDGTFGNINQLVTSYYPGEMDVTTGYAELSLTGISVAPCVDDITHSFTLTLWPLPEVSFASIDTLCLVYPPYQLTEGSPAGGVYSGPGVANGWFSPSVAGIGLHVLTYTYTDLNGCSNSAQQTVVVDACTGVSETPSFDFTIYPNPGNGNFIISSADLAGKSINIELYNCQGNLVFKAENTFSRDAELTLNVENPVPGIYYLRLNYEGRVLTQKLIIK